MLDKRIRSFGSKKLQHAQYFTLHSADASAALKVWALQWQPLYHFFQTINSLMLQTSASGEMQTRILYRQQHHGYYHVHITNAASTHRQGGCVNSG